MKRKYIKNKYKEYGGFDTVKMLRMCEDIIKLVVTDQVPSLKKKGTTISEMEFCELTDAFGIMLDTAFFRLPIGERLQMLDDLEAGKITPSQAERLIYRSEGILPPSKEPFTKRY